MRTVGMASILVCAVATAGIAQTAHDGAYLGGGFEAVGAGADYERAWGFSLQGGYVRQYRRAGVRLGASYFERNRNFNPFSQRRTVGLNVELTYDLTTSRFRPYIIGGWGLYRMWGQSFSSYSGFQTFDGLSPAMIGGLGFRYRLKGVELFAEGRLHGLTSRRDWAAPFMPVTFGLKFD
jgi:hypothetical protein